MHILKDLISLHESCRCSSRYIFLSHQHKPAALIISRSYEALKPRRFLSQTAVSRKILRYKAAALGSCFDFLRYIANMLY